MSRTKQVLKINLKRDHHFSIEAEKHNKRNRSFSPNKSLKLPQLQKPASEEKRENQINQKDNEDISPYDELQVQKIQHQFKPLPVTPSVKNSYPNLTLMSKLLTDQNQKKSLQKIMQKHPNLAASLNVYASSHNQMKKHKKFKKQVVLKIQNDIAVEKYQQQPEMNSKLSEILEINPKDSQIENQKQQSLQIKTSTIRHKWKKQQSEQNITPKYCYYLGKGNNEDIIKRVMNTRKHWMEVPIISSAIHFRWQQNYYGYNFEKMGLDKGESKREIYNHFEFHKEITTKTGLVKNLQKHCAIVQSDPFHLTPTVFTINLEDKNYQKELNLFHNFYQYNMPDSFKKTQTITKGSIELDLPVDTTNYVSPYRFNYDATQSYNISGTKPVEENPTKLSDTFLSNINYLWLLKPADMNRGNGVHVFSSLEELEILLTSYYTGWYQKDFESPSKLIKKNDSKIKSEVINILATNMDTIQTNDIEQQLEKENAQETIIPLSGSESAVDNLDIKPQITLIDQPSENNQQLESNNEAIDLVKTSLDDDKIQISDLDQQTSCQKTIDSAIDGLNDQAIVGIQQQKKGIYMKCRQFVIQKYLEKPFLINERKFDIRIWVVMTHQMQFYIFKEGYIRTSSEKFSLDDVVLNLIIIQENPFIHLTNNAVQKYSKNYSQFEGGNQITFDDFQHYLDQHPENYHFKRKCLPKIKEIISTSLQSVKSKLNRMNRKFCFEIFGYDFILDASLNPWLIEVNTNPCIEESSNLLKMYIPRMIDDAFKMTIDVVFPDLQNKEQMTSTGIQYFPVKGYSDKENMWEFLGQY